MLRPSLGTNLSSLTVQRHLQQAAQGLSATFERLSSGQRINRASDDAAGLAVAEDLRAESRVMAQALRNVNDGVSLLNIQTAALQELQSILQRQQEIAEQAANGTYTRTQRLAMQRESDALTEEHNRIIATTEFNGISVLSYGSTSIQAGSGANAVVPIAFAAELGRAVGDGSFEAKQDSFANGRTWEIKTADLNGDGNLDIVSGNYNDQTISAMLGNGDGTFAGGQSFSVGTTMYQLALGDYNSDGKLDIATANNNQLTIGILLGNGNGTFGFVSTFSTGVGTYALQTADINDDGDLDLIYTGFANGDLGVRIGNGDGTFSRGATFRIGAQAPSVALGDLNGDGNLDMVASSWTARTVTVLTGNGDGSFAIDNSFSAAGTYPTPAVLRDIDRDGLLDLLFLQTSGDSYLQVMHGRGDGTFSTGASFVVGASTGDNVVDDFNGDGLLDFAQQNGLEDTVSVLLGCGDGTFLPRISFATGDYPTGGLMSGDFNEDGVVDLVSSNFSAYTFSLLLGSTRQTGEMPYLNLMSTADALASLTLLEEAQERTSAELGAMGAMETRLGHTSNFLSSMREQLTAAHSRIVDADVAEEAAKLVRHQILQQAATAMLAQANQQASVALRLLAG